MAVNINVPSQVKTYANLAAFPATGALKTIYIAEDTNKTYRWTGSVYTEISASAAMTWGAIGGTLSNQTDLQNALDAKVPTSRTLTINGVTQDLSANRTFTISTGITIGSTAIASGVVGRVLFEGAGNVVQESANLFWDNTNGRLGIGTSSPSDVITLLQPIGFQSILRFQTLDNTIANGYSGFNCFDNSGSLAFSFAYGNPNSLLPNSAIIGPRNATGRLSFVTGSSAVSQITMFPSGNLLLQNGGTHTDAGFRLDVNGTARVQGNAQFGTGFYWDNTNNRLGIGGSPATYNLDVKGIGIYRGGALDIQNTTGSTALSFYPSAGNIGIIYSDILRLQRISNSTVFLQGFASGNVGINTTTDAGFRLDVNGSGRFNNEFILNRSDGVEMFRMNNSPAVLTFNGDNSSTPTLRFHSQSNILFYLKASENRIGINTTTPNASAIMDVTSTTQGFLPPRMTTTQKNAIATPAAGLMVYDTTLNKLCVYTTAWETVTSL